MSDNASIYSYIHNFWLAIPDKLHALYYHFQSSQEKHILNTFVVSASVTNASSPIKDLDEDVKVMLHHLKPNTVRSTVISNMADSRKT